MNGPHLATGRFEVGNFNLVAEQSNNIDLTFNYSNDGLYAGLTFFHNDVDNYIYLMDETEADHDAHDEDEHHGDLVLANYLQQDAEFDGYELEIGKTFDLCSRRTRRWHSEEIPCPESSQTDSNIPRMTPERDLYKVVYVADNT